MRGRIFVFALTAALAFPANALESPGIDPTTADALETVCHAVRDAQIQDNSSLDGRCVGGTGGFLGGVMQTAPDTIEPVVADVTTRLALLVEEEVKCKLVETEIPQAIRLASTYSKDPEQVERIIRIAETIEACQLGATQAIDLSALREIASDTGA